MRLSRTFTLVMLVLAATPLLRADATLRYTVAWKGGSALPLAGASGFKLPTSAVLRLQGNQALYQFGEFTSIIDVQQKTITLLDPAHQRYATTPLGDYARQAATAGPLAQSLPPAMQSALQAMQVAFATHASPNPDTILGVATQKTDYTITVSINPAAMGRGANAAATEAPPQPMLRVEVQCWTALPAELARVPALGELAAFTSANAALVDPFADLKVELGTLPPALADGLSQVTTAMRQVHSVTLRAHIALYMPMLDGLLAMARLGQNLGPNNAAAPAAPAPGSPLGEMTLTAAELSSAPVEATAFAIPAGYTVETMDALTAALLPAPPKPAAPRRPAGPPPLPAAAKLNPGEALRPEQLGWLASSAGSSSAEVVAHPGFGTLLVSLTPDSTYHMGRDLPLAQAFNSVLHGPAFPVATYPGGHLIIGSQRGNGGRGRALLWVDAHSGLAVGGLLIYTSNGAPSPALTLFTTQINAPVDALERLPRGFAADFAQWSNAKQLPERPAMYFINRDGERSVILHPPLDCRHGDRALCQAADSDAAETDLAAALYLVRQRLTGAAVAQALEQEQQQWSAARDAQCKDLACRTQQARQRAQALISLAAHPPGA